jgi:beta-galactosidase
LGILTISQITTPNATCVNGGGGGAGAAVPSAPANLAATAVSTSQINLNWSASSGSGITYNVYASSLSTFAPSGGTQIATGLTAASYQSSGLSASTTYYYLVTAANSAGESLPSNVARATTQANSGPQPASPTGLSATAMSSGQINLTWTASSTTGATYDVYASMTSGVTATPSNRIASGLSSTNYQSTGLGASTTYYYVVTALTSTGESVASNIANATTSAAQAGGSITLPIPISDVANLSNILAAKPNMGTTYSSNSAAMIDSSGNIGSVSGSPTNCVLVNGTSAPCSSGGLPIAISNVTNLSATLSTLSSEFSTLNSTVSTQGSSLVSLQTTVGSLSTTATSLSSSLTNLSSTVSTLPVKGTGITSGRTAFIDSTGNLNTVSGNASD